MTVYYVANLEEWGSHLDAECFQGVEFHVIGEADGDISEKDIDRIESKGGGGDE